MSVQHETGATRSTERTEAAPELQYRAISQDSLSMFLAAIGGAVLGMLLTLLVLALINGGTLTYAGQWVEEIEPRLQQVDENVGAINANVDLVSEQAAALQQQLGAIDTALRTELASQGGELDSLNEAVVTLNRTREQFDTFVNALADALIEIGAVEAPAATETAATVTEETAAEEAAAPPVAPSAAVTATTLVTETAPLTTTTELTAAAPIIEATPLTDSADMTETTVFSEDVATAETTATAETETVSQVALSTETPTDTVAVLIFVDENQDGIPNDEEIRVEGISVSLQDSQGEPLATTESTESGVAFANLPAGDYQVVIAQTPGYTLTGDATVLVTVAPDATAGAVVLMPVTTE